MNKNKCKVLSFFLIKSKQSDTQCLCRSKHWVKSWSNYTVAMLKLAERLNGAWRLSTRLEWRVAVWFNTPHKPTWTSWHTLPPSCSRTPMPVPSEEPLSCCLQTDLWKNKQRRTHTKEKNTDSSLSSLNNTASAIKKGASLDTEWNCNHQLGNSILTEARRIGHDKDSSNLSINDADVLIVTLTNVSPSFDLKL